jgi:hypothetical protein
VSISKHDLSFRLTQLAPGETLSLSDDDLVAIFGQSARTREELLTAALTFAWEHDAHFSFDPQIGEGIFEALY